MNKQENKNSQKIDKVKTKKVSGGYKAGISIDPLSDKWTIWDEKGSAIQQFDNLNDAKKCYVSIYYQDVLENIAKMDISPEDCSDLMSAFIEKKGSEAMTF